MFSWIKKLFQEEKFPYTDANGYTYMISKNYKELINEAEKGIEEAQYELTSDYFVDFIEYVPEVVFKWTKYLSEKENDFSVMFEMGELYEKGIGCDVDYKEALKWYNKTLELLKSKPENFHIPASPKELLMQVEEAIQDLSEKYTQV